MNRRWMIFLLPLSLGIGGLLLLIRILVFDTNIFRARNFDLVIIVIGIGLSTFVAINIIIQMGLEHLREQSILKAREQAFAEHRRFLSRLDHELKNPLTAVRAGLGTLMMTSIAENQRHILQTLDLEAQRLSRLVGDLRKLADLQNLTLEPVPVDVEALIQEVILLEKDRIELQHRVFQTSITAPISRIRGDQELLLLALHNLLDNALKYTRPDDKILLEVHAEEGALLIKVRDTGIGLDAQEAELVWEELYRGKNSAGIPGSGIGLALVQSIVRRHNGQVSLHSQPEQGTIVTMWLPEG